VKGKKMVAVISGTNMDFSKLRLIAAGATTGAHRQKFLCFEIGEKSGSLLDLIQTHFHDVNISAFQYGKVSNDDAFPVIAFEADPARLEQIVTRLDKAKVPYKDITGEPDTGYRIINYNPSLFTWPVFLHVHFPERKGALRELLKTIRPVSNICYFNYVYTGETIGRAIMGFEFKSSKQHREFFRLVAKTPVTVKPVEAETLKRILYS
jgi:threonine dehydratase